MASSLNSFGKVSPRQQFPVPTCADDAASAAASRLVFLAGQVLLAHTLAAVLAEMVFRREGFAFPGIYGTAEFAVFAIAPLFVQTLLRGPKGAALAVIGSFKYSIATGELLRFGVCGLAMVCSHGAGLAAYIHINTTTAMLFSSARLPTVIVAGAFLLKQKKAPPLATHLAALCVAVGLSLFGFAERRDTPRFSTAGLTLIAANLCLGAVTFNLQQRALHMAGASRKCPRGADTLMRLEAGLHRGEEPGSPYEPCSPRSSIAREGGSRPSARAKVGSFPLECLPVGGVPLLSDPERMMMIQYSVAAPLMLLYAWAVGEVYRFPIWCTTRHETPAEELLPVICQAILAAVGVQALLCITQEFDAARSSTITSVRKVITFVLSFLIFPKPFSGLHLIGILLAGVGSVWLHRSLSHRGGREPAREKTVVRSAGA